jgi:hypothetical protein
VGRRFLGREPSLRSNLLGLAVVEKSRMIAADGGQEGNMGLCIHTAEWTRTSMIMLCCFLFSCGRQPGSSTSNVVFDKVPHADVGGPDKMETIEGHATGVGPGQRIVLYTKSAELWWVQPSTANPITTIQGESRWKNQTHLGIEYAGLLVEAGYMPPQTTEVLPGVGNGVVAVTVVKGQGPMPIVAPIKTLHFSGYEWTARSAGSYRGGSHNSFDPANAWTDENGALHLSVTKSGMDWFCSEVKLTRSLGYGTYRFVVLDASSLEPSMILTLSTSDGVGTEENRRELDIEISRWGSAANDNSQYVVQPYYIPVNIVRFPAPGGKLTQSIHWEPGRATFSTTVGPPYAATPRVVNQHVFTSGVPSAGGDSVRMNLYIFGKGQIPVKNNAEIVIEKFEYLP